MGLITWLKEVFNKMLGRNEITQPFNVVPEMDGKMFQAIADWDRLYTQSSTNIASIICSEAARLATLDMTITCEEIGNGKRIQEILDRNRDKLRSKLELGIAYGGLVLKPNGEGKGGIDFVPTNRFMPISFDSNGNLQDVIFIDTYTKSNKYYTRLEYHHRDEFGEYVIENKFFVNDTKYTLGKEISAEGTKWRGISPIVTMSGIERPLFGYYKNPQANNIDIDSPLSTSLFSKSVLTMEDFDMAYSKWRKEILHSDKVIFVDEASMLKPSDKGGRAEVINPMPEVIKGLRFGNNASSCIEEYNPAIRVEECRKTLQTQLDLISVQCGFSAGYFSFDETKGIVTATEIESDDKKTNSTCTDIQANYKLAIIDLVVALDKMMQLYSNKGEQVFAISFYAKDLFVNESDDRDRAYQLAQNGYIPKWKYLVDYEGYSEEEAREMVRLAQEELESNKQ